MKRRIAMVTLKPRQGRQKLAQGPARRDGVASSAPSPCPLPRRAREGGKGGWGPISPGLPIESIGTGFALGYYLPPLPGLVRLTSRITRTAR